MTVNLATVASWIVTFVSCKAPFGSYIVALHSLGAAFAFSVASFAFSVASFASRSAAGAVAFVTVASRVVACASRVGRCYCRSGNEARSFAAFAFEVGTFA
jgi:hypothetical protein